MRHNPLNIANSVIRDAKAIHTISGQYDGLVEGALAGNDAGQDLFITYRVGGGNDVVLFTNAVPEPTTVLIWSMLAGLGTTVRRRR